MKNQKVKAILGVIIVGFILVFVFVQIGLANQLGWTSYQSVEEFERLTDHTCLKIYDIYDYLYDDKLNLVTQGDYTIERLDSDHNRYRIVDGEMK